MERQRFRINNRKVAHKQPRMPSPTRLNDPRRVPPTARPRSPDRRAHNRNINIRRQQPNQRQPVERLITRSTSENNIPRGDMSSPSRTQTSSGRNDRNPSMVVTAGNQGRGGLYPTMSKFYQKERLDYSPAEPVADYPYQDDLPINNFYPQLNISTVPEINVQPSINNNINSTVNNLPHNVSPNNNNLNINLAEMKVLNDKRFDLNESITNNNETESCICNEDIVSIESRSVVPTESRGIVSTESRGIVPTKSHANSDETPDSSSATPATDIARPDRNSFQKKCDASKFIDENTPPIKLNDHRAPIKMTYADRKAEFDIDNPPKSPAEFDQWMTWRKQVNRHMASMILIKQGKDVYVAPSEVNRKPLAKTTMQSVIDRSKDNSKNSALGGKRYVMYGIPRAKLPA